jgi:hypothetical protein
MAGTWQPGRTWLSKAQGINRGFKRKGGCVYRITFRVTTRLRSKSSRRILHTTLAIWLLTQPWSFNKSKLLVQLLLNIFTEKNWYKHRYLFLTMGIIIRNLFGMRNFQICLMVGNQTLFFYHRDPCPTTIFKRSNINSNMLERILRP